MAETKAVILKDDLIRVTCGECGSVHEVAVTDAGKVEVTTFLVKKKEEENNEQKKEEKKPRSRFFKES